jgi:DNA-binding FrmR family transcriptional regulator
MLEEGRYCDDVLTQIDAVTAALARVQDQILEAHLQHCVPEALEGEDLAARREKVDEIVGLLRQFRRSPSRGPE